MDVLAVGINDAARVIGVGRTKIYELIKAHKLETVMIGRRRLVKVASIHSLIGGNG